MPGILWWLHKLKYLRFNNIHFRSKKRKLTFLFNIISCKSIEVSHRKSFSLLPMRKKISSPRAHDDLSLSSLWVHSDQNVKLWPCRELTMMKMLTASSPRQFVFSWDFHKDSSTCIHCCLNDFDHLVQNAICHKCKIIRITHINKKIQPILFSNIVQFRLKEILIKIWVGCRNSNDCTMHNETNIHPKLHAVHLMPTG